MKHLVDNNKKRLAEITNGNWITVKVNDQVFGAEVEDAYSTASSIKLADLALDYKLEEGTYLLLRMRGDVGLELEIP